MNGGPELKRRQSRDSSDERRAGAKLLWLLIGASAGVLLLAAIARGLPQRALRVVAGEPDRGGQVGAWGPLHIRFSEPLASALPSNAVRIEGQPSPSVEVDGSSIVVRPAVALPAGEGHSLELSPDLLGADGSRLGAEVSWSFTVRDAAIAFLRREGGAWRLYRTAGEGPRLLSGEREVTSYSPAPDGSGVVFSGRNREGGSDLWWVDRNGENLRQLLECGPDRCLEPAWAPDEERIAFVRRPSGVEVSQEPRIWTLPLDGGEPAPLYQDPARRGTAPTWSPDGLRLAYYDPSVQGVRVLDLDTVTEDVLPTGTGVSGAWSPDGGSLLLPVMEFEGETPLTALYKLDLSREQVTPVLRRGSGWRQVAVPAWSPEGDWIALAALREGSGPVPLMWRMRPDGSQAQTVGALAGYAFGGPDWDPWGERLLFQRLRTGEPDAEPDLMVWSRQDGTDVRLTGAASGSWLP